MLDTPAVDFRLLCLGVRQRSFFQELSRAVEEACVEHPYDIAEHDW